jgi:hypothetical protein
MSRFPVDVIQEVIPRLVNELGWIERVGAPSPQTPAQVLPPPLKPEPKHATGKAVPDRFEEFWELYPRKVGQDSACHDWINYVHDGNVDDVFACLRRYLKSREVSTGAVMNPGTTPSKLGWIASCAKDGWKTDWPAATSGRAQSLFK